MRSVLLGSFIQTLLAITISALLITFAGAGDHAKMINSGGEKIAISGYDTVAYFTVAKPMKGKPEFSASWQDVDWYFANSEHRDLFVASPARYAPQFGGFCAMAMTRGVVKTIDPQAWVIVDGRLYLNFSEDARDRFQHDPLGNIDSSEKNWAKLQPQN